MASADTAPIANAVDVRLGYLRGKLMGNKCGHKVHSFDEIEARGGEFLALRDSAVAAGLLADTRAAELSDGVESYLARKAIERAAHTAAVVGHVDAITDHFDEDDEE